MSDHVGEVGENRGTRSPDADRRQEAQLIEGGRRGRDAVAELLARARRSATGGKPDRSLGGTPDGRPSVGKTTGGTGDAPADGPWDVDRLASAIAARAAGLIGGGTVDPETDLFDAGATSVTAVELVATLVRELNVRLSLDDVFADARPRRLAQRWLAEPGTQAPPADAAAPPGPRQPVAIRTGARTPARIILPRPAEIALPVHRLTPATGPVCTDEDLSQILADLGRVDTLPFVGAPEPVVPRRILLTGATGFLGSHILFDLLRRSDAQVVCLVRAADEQLAEKRLAEALAGYHLPWSAELRRRVTLLPGDVRQPRLGLTEDRWLALAHEIDSIVSVAAAVDFLRGYQSLRQSNVLGPLILAELATTGPVKPLHQISSTAVFNEPGIAAIGDDTPLAHIDKLPTGYEQSKWAAEVALRRAREHGLTVTLLRPGAIGGHTQTGAYNPQDLLTGFLSAITRYRIVPALRAFNIAPVDWVSRVAASVVCEPDGWGKTYNLTGKPNSLEDLIRDTQLSGMNLRIVDWDEWRERFFARVEEQPVPALDPLVRVLSSSTGVRLCEANLFNPPATAERTDAFVERYKLPEAERYDSQAQLKSYERMAEDGLAALPHRDDSPYLWFPETMRGRLGPVGEPADTACTLKMQLSIASMYQLVKERRIDILEGEVRCERLHAEPLTVLGGDIWVRPHHGIPRAHGIRHPLLRYRVRLRDADGGLWWLEGQKTARARRDLMKQARTLAVELGREGEPASLSGVVVVPSDSYVREQIDGIKVKADLTSQERRLAKVTWMAWFGWQIGQGLMEPMMRAGAELLDLRRTRLEERKR
ncbi:MULTISPECIES: thioester reductase domain-containing protein [unclassified Streptomyces]|uniref:thioester reductase domain-containing protein n=1 Tax=unclassified Streptomyces TaxID=2593676 RepID=UPI0037FE29F1